MTDTMRTIYEDKEKLISLKMRKGCTYVIESYNEAMECLNREMERLLQLRTVVDQNANLIMSLNGVRYG